MIYIFLSLIIVVCLGVVFYIIKNKSYQLQQAEDRQLPKQKQEQVKKKIIEQRLKGKIVKGVSELLVQGKVGIRLLQDLKGQIWGKWGDIYKTGKKIKYQRKSVDDDKLKLYLTEAETMLRQRKFEEAERKFIEILKEDSRKVEAYLGLGKVYVAKKDWEKAEQIYKYILKIDDKAMEAYRELSRIFNLAKRWEDLKYYSQKALDLGLKESWLYINLGTWFRKTGYPEKAEEWFERAVEQEPDNEQYLDCLMDVCIINKNKALAGKTYNTLKQVTSDELKLQSYRDKIDIL